MAAIPDYYFRYMHSDLYTQNELHGLRIDQEIRRLGAIQHTITTDIAALKKANENLAEQCEKAASIEKTISSLIGERNVYQSRVTGMRSRLSDF